MHILSFSKARAVHENQNPFLFSAARDNFRSVIKGTIGARSIE